MSSSATAVLIGPDGKLIGRYHKQKLGHELVRNNPGKEKDQNRIFYFDLPLNGKGSPGTAGLVHPSSLALCPPFPSRRDGATWLPCLMR